MLQASQPSRERSRSYSGVDALLAEIDKYRRENRAAYNRNEAVQAEERELYERRGH